MDKQILDATMAFGKLISLQELNDKISDGFCITCSEVICDSELCSICKIREMMKNMIAVL